MTNILGQIQASTFLSEYWQSQPLLIRQAMSHVHPEIDANTLAGLALEETVRSRIVLETRGTPNWNCQYGPFDEQDFSALPDKQWTLLVQDVEKHLPEYAEILEYFSFLPRWRIDDLMVSYAVDGGSVGPHIDQYDVFLLQASGQRRWQLQIENIDEHNLIEDTELQILKNFTADTEWVLNPGDMLYLPPGVAHYGIAIGESITYSVGFRAPSQTDLLQAFTEQFSLNNNHPRFYQDQVLKNSGRGELGHDDIAQMQRLLAQAMDNDAIMTRSIGNLLTIPVDTPSLFNPEPIDISDFIKMLDEGTTIHLHPALRCVYIMNEDGITVYMNTTEYLFDTPIAPVVVELCNNFQLRGQSIELVLSNEKLVLMLYELFQQGYLDFEHQDTSLG